jgi:predicted enzyme related to lactoylglutathione lyase
MQVMASGEMAVFTDPTGAAFSVWKAGEHIGAEIGNVADTYSWSELLTRDVEAAKAFYSEVFGWTYDIGAMPDGSYHLIEGGDEGWGGVMAMPDEMPDMVPNHWAVYFTVTDLQDALAKITGNGGQVVQEPMTVPGVGTFATVHDPAGGNFTVMQPESS